MNIRDSWLSDCVYILLPKQVRGMFDKGSIFIKKIPLKLVMDRRNNYQKLKNYRQSPTRFYPFMREFPMMSHHPYVNFPDDPGVRTDVRYYDYTNGPVQGTPPSEIE